MSSTKRKSIAPHVEHSAPKSPSHNHVSGNVEYSRSTRVFGALFYAVASILIMMVNKYVLYVYEFPSVSTLALSQFVFTVVSLKIMKEMGVISYPEPTLHSIKAVFPLPLFYVGNAVTGLSGTKALSLPMFTVLRRTNMVITMALETYLLKSEYSLNVKLSVLFMLFGSVIAAFLDMEFDAAGYAATLFNNIFTSAGGVITKMKLNKTSSQDDKQALNSVWGLMYVNSLIGSPLLFLLLLIFYQDTLMDAYNYDRWSDPAFLCLFLMSSAMGTVLQFSIFYCTKVNSALTTVVTGVLKNILTAYMGMIDARLGYTFNLMNFLGVNISMLGGVWYAYLQFVENAARTVSKNSVKIIPEPEDDHEKQEPPSHS